MKNKIALNSFSILFMLINFTNVSNAKSQMENNLMKNENGMISDGVMSSKQMQSLMHDCMALNKGTEVCDNQMFENCRKKMGTIACKNMLGEVKQKEIGKNIKK